MNINDISPVSRSGVRLTRRLLAIIYDLFLLIALWFVSSALTTAFNHGEALSNDTPYKLLFEITLLLISFFYFAWFWTHGGQTLGMKTWKIKLSARNGKALDWQRAGVYFLAAILSWTMIGLGFIWSLFRHDRATWHDLIADCVMLDLH